MSRRTFMGSIGLGALAWACGGSEQAAAPSPSAADSLSLFPTAPQGLAVGDSRQAFAIVRGSKPIAPDGVSIALLPPEGDPPAPLTPEKVTIRFGFGGEDHEHEQETEVQEIYVVRHTFDVAGVWEVNASFGSDRVKGAFQVSPESASPIIGQQAKPADSPTTDDARGVDPICTRKPPCSMHELTVAEALQRRKPAVVIFGTPAYCTSRTCGPVVDHVEAAAEEFGDAASFVHVEVWKTPDSVGKQDGVVGAFAEWSLQTEPWTYFIDAKGVVRDRWQGAVGHDEIVAATGKLVAGEL